MKQGGFNPSMTHRALCRPAVDDIKLDACPNPDPNAGVDYIKLDSCLHQGGKEDARLRAELTPEFSKAVDASGRAMWLNFHCNGPPRRRRRRGSRGAGCGVRSAESGAAAAQCTDSGCSLTAV